MHPYLLRVGTLWIPSYPLMYSLGMTLAAVVVMVLGRREGISARRLAHLVMLLSVAVVVGGRLFYVLQHFSHYRDEWQHGLNISEGGQVLYGGLFLAVLSLIGFCRVTGCGFWQVSDWVAIGSPLGLAVGRIGCLLSGCCYGKLTSLGWGVSFPQCVDLTGRVVGSAALLRHIDLGVLHAGAEHSLPVHPSQVYEALISGIIFAVMLLLWYRGLFRGRMLFIYLILFSTTRFVTEFWRDNEMAFLGLTVPQVVGIAVLGGAIFGLVTVGKSVGTVAAFHEQGVSTGSRIR